MEERKLGETTHFSEIIKSFNLEENAINCYGFTAFSNYCCLIISEKCFVVPKFLAKNYVFAVINWAKYFNLY